MNGFVHDLRPPQLHMFLSEADRVYPHLPQFLLHPLHKKTEKVISSAERERVRKLIHRLHVSGGHVSKTSDKLGLVVFRGFRDGRRRLTTPLDLHTSSIEMWTKNLRGLTTLLRRRSRSGPNHLPLPPPSPWQLTSRIQ